MEQHDLDETLEWLTTAPAQDRATMLEVLAQAPTGEARLHPAIGALLDDRSVVVMGPPLRWTELRRLAATALAAERGAAGLEEPVTLSALPPVLDLQALERAATTVFGAEASRWRPAERYTRLRDARALPLADIVFRPEPRSPRGAEGDGAGAR